jgi:hypothetical protein
MLNWTYLKENTRVSLYVISWFSPGQRQIHSGKKWCFSKSLVDDVYDEDDDDNNANRTKVK